jgi:hypothetical protein
VVEGLEGVNREAFLEGVRSRLRSWRLRSKVPSPWDDADVICYSPMFWRARMVSYEAWGMLYLRLAYRPRLVRLMVPMLGLTPVLFLSPVLGAGALVGLLAVFLLECWLFRRRVHRALVIGR